MENCYEEIYHHGIKGQRWGIRRFQNRDGSLTSKGQKHRDIREGRSNEKDVIQQPPATSGSSSAETATTKKGLSKGAKTALILSGVAAATAVGILATRKFNIEKRALDGVLKTYGNQLLSSQQKLSNRLLELESGSKYANKTGTELRRMGERAITTATKRESKYRATARAGSGAARYLNDVRLDSLANKVNFTGSINNTDFARMLAGQAASDMADYAKRLLGLAG